MGQEGKAESRGLGEKPGITAPTPKRQAPSRNGAMRRDDRRVASPQGRLGVVPVVRNWFNMWNSHVVEVL